MSQFLCFFSDEYLEATKDALNYVIDYYNDTSYNGSVKLNQLYSENKNTGFLSFYVDVKDACNITDEKAKELELPTTFVTAAIQHDELFQAYMYQYEDHSYLQSRRHT